MHLMRCSLLRWGAPVPIALPTPRPMVRVADVCTYPVPDASQAAGVNPVRAPRSRAAGGLAAPHDSGAQLGALARP
jgi:hypothetical protein